MRTVRTRRLLAATVLVLAATPAASPAAILPGQWDSAASLVFARSRPTVTRLADGRVLVAGGWREHRPVSSVEIYDPQSAAWTLAAPLSTPRADHAAALLADGRVLVAAGFDGAQVLASSEIFDPATNAWTAGPPMRRGRRGLALTTLEDGRVLATGGRTSIDCSGPGMSQTEILDVQQSSWREHGLLFSGRAFHSATLLPGDQVLLVGDAGASHGSRGMLGQPEVFDVTTGVSTPGTVSFSTTGHTATPLADGRILVAGGCCLFAPLPGATLTPSEEIGAANAATYDPFTGVWLPTSPMGTARAWHTATPLPDGRVVVAGGVAIRPGMHRVGMRDDVPVADAEIFNPVTNSWGQADRLREPRLDHVAVALPGGGVLIAGGVGEHAGRPLSSAEQFMPPPVSPPAAPTVQGPAQPVPQPPPVPTLAGRFHEAWQIAQELPVPRTGVAASVLPNGNVLVVGGAGIERTVGTNRVDVYDPVRNRWLTAPSMREARAGPVATTLPDGRILVTSSGTPEIFSPSTSSWASTSPPPISQSGAPAVLLHDGRVLLAGGAAASSRCEATTVAQIYDPEADTWSITARMVYRRRWHSATVLPDGRVLVAGGNNNATGEIYDPRTEQWTTTRMMHAARAGHTAHPLPDGRVLVIGGCCVHIPSALVTLGELDDSPAEIYDPSANAWTLTPPMRYARVQHASAVLPDGSVIVAGGRARRGLDERSFVADFDDIASTEVYDIRAHAWVSVDSLLGARYNHAMVTLPNGTVLTIGGTETFEERQESRVVPYVDLYALPNSIR